MRLGAAPGAFGARADSSRIPEPTPRKRSTGTKARDQRRAEAHRKRSLEAAAQDRRDIRNERNPLARRHLGDAAHIAPDELPAKDWTRERRAGEVTEELDKGYEAKRQRHE